MRWPYRARTALAAVAALAYLWRGWKTVLIAAVLTFVGLAAALFILIALVTRNM